MSFLDKVIYLFFGLSVTIVVITLILYIAYKLADYFNNQK